MGSQYPSSQNRNAGCESPGVFSGNGGRTPPKPSGDRNQSLNGAGSPSGGQQGTSSFPPTFSGDELRPLQTDFFRHCSLFFAHLGPEEESEQWASYLPEYLRPGNIDNYLEETDNPQLYGNNYWWLSEEDAAQEQPSFNQGSDHIRYSRDQLLKLREWKVMAIPENILKIKQELEAECLGVNQFTKCGGTKAANIPVNSTKNAPQAGDKEKHEVANISVNLMEVSLERGDTEKHEVANVPMNSMKEAPETTEKEKHEVANISINSMPEGPQLGEKEKQEVLVSESKKEKKKRRVLTDERKEKRRIAKKKKRAEKNRKVGAKRLKIQPLLKPKPVSHCRHYLKGRCHEGEKCKFSHDVQPLTKSLPCCHFARQSCMKGDDCPYDHDLSKYPCNKYVSTGFCPRQENCLFSHKVTPNQDPAPTTGATKPETKASNPPPASSDSIQKPHFVFGSVTAESSRGNVSASKAVKAPHGLSFLNNGNSQKDKQPVPGSTSADVTVSGKAAFGGDQKGTALPSNPPTSPNPAGVFAFGKNPPPDHNPPASPNSAGVFVLGKNPPHDHNPPASPNSAGVFVSEKNSNKTPFGGDQKGAPLPSNSPTLPNPAGVYVFGKNPPPDHNLPALPNSAGVIVSEKNSNKTAFGGDQKGAPLPPNSPTLPNPAGVFAFGENPPPDHNLLALPNSAGVIASGKNSNKTTSRKNSNKTASRKSSNKTASRKNGNKTVFGGDQKGAALPSNPPAMPNPAGVFMLGRIPPPDHNIRHQPSSLPSRNNNKTAFGRGKKGSAAPSFSARLGGLNTSSPSASGPSPVNGSWANQNQGTGTVSGSEPFESRVNVHASGGTNSESADAGNNGGAGPKEKLSAVEVWEILYGKGSTQ